jgi:hypothetical protein
LAFGEVLRLAEEPVALLERDEIEQMCDGIVGRRKPVGGPG